MDEQRRLHGVWTLAGYALVAIILCIALSGLAARMTAAQLLAQADQQLARVEAHQPLWQWHLHRPGDLIAGRAFGNATVAGDTDALTLTSTDGTLFELGLPIDWAVDLAHWPILQVELQGSATGTLGVLWGAGHTPSCKAAIASVLKPDARSLRIDLRDLSWQSVSGGACQSPGVAQMLRLSVQIPAHASLRLTSVALLTTEPLAHASDSPIELLPGEVEQATTRAQGLPMPLFRLPVGISAETMLALRDRLRTRWPAALIVPAGGTPQAIPQKSHTVAQWAGCVVYLALLIWFALRPPQGRLRPWLEIAGCLLGPLWLIIGLNWGLKPAPLGVLAFGGGLAYALFIERRHLSRLWRLPSNGGDWLWPLATVPVTFALIVMYGHKLHPLPPAHVFAYFGWAWLQQWLMLVVLFRRFEQIGAHRPELAVLPVALAFALLHTPNGMLMQLCLAAELWWGWCFLRSRSVLPIGLAHAACALLVESGLAGALVRSLEVSGRFFL